MLRDDILQAMSEDLTFKEIAAKVGCSVKHVSETARQNGFGRDDRRYQTKYDYNRMHDLRRQGMTIQQIAQEVGASKSHVFRIVSGYSSKSKQIPVTTKEVSRFIGLWNQGYSISEISRELSRAEDTVSKYLKNALPRQIERRIKHRKVPVGEIIILHHQGRSAAYIADSMGFHIKTIWRVLNESGYGRPRKKVDEHAQAQ